MAKTTKQDGEGKLDERARNRALVAARSLLETIHRAIVDIESNGEAAAAAVALVKRLQRAQVGAATERSLEQRLIVEYLHAYRQPVRVLDKARTTARGAVWGNGEASRAIVRGIRKDDPLSGALDDWSEVEILQALRAERFDVTMSRLFGKHGTSITAKAIEKIVRLAKKRRALLSK